MKDDPCFRCSLPDCDDRSPRCGIRRLYKSYRAKAQQGEHHLISAAEREANNQIFDSWRLERLAQAAEGVRPYRRKGSPWTGEEAR